MNTNISYKQKKYLHKYKNATDASDKQKYLKHLKRYCQSGGADGDEVNNAVDEVYTSSVDIENTFNNISSMIYEMDELINGENGYVNSLQKKTQKYNALITKYNSAVTKYDKYKDMEKCNQRNNAKKINCIKNRNNLFDKIFFDEMTDQDNESK